MPIPPRPHSVQTPLSGFTLVELLAVIAIIAIVAAIAFPVVQAVQQRSATAKCSSNMRQVGVAMLAYAADNNGILPPPQNPDTGKVWFEAITPYLSPDAFDPKKPNSLICPVWREIWRTKFSSAPASDWRRVGMGMSIVMVGSPTKGWPDPGAPDPKRLTRAVEIAKNSQAIMVAEENSWSWGIHAQNYLTSSYFKPSSGQERGNRHGKGANFLFVDGHVELLNQDNILPYLAK